MKIKAYLYARQYDFEKEPRWLLFYAKIDDDANTFFVAEHELEVPVPENFDITSAKLAALRGEKQRILAVAQVKANNIEDQIQRLLCIEHKAEAA